MGELHDALAAAGIEVDAETFIFIDEARGPPCTVSVMSRSMASSMARASM